MNQFVIVVETGYNSGSSNYRIKHTGSLSQDEAVNQFNALRAGTDQMFSAVDGATIVTVSDTQFLRLHKSLTGTMMDRVTMGSATTQQA